ncbi:DUF3450 domain-containing protein [bacterium]|nr:DUF3450 domain-containing protein [bacterium]
MKFLFTILLITINAKASTWENFVEKLTQTRLDVETLSQEIDSLQKEKQNDLEQWSQRKTELEGQIQKEQLRSLQIGEKLKRLESRVKLQSKTDPQAQRKLLAWIERFETWVPSTIPFLHESRQESLKNLKIRAQKSQEPIEFVMADFWLFVESEMKLAQSNEYKIVDIQFAGQKKKCEVARLGLQSLFVVTPDKKILKASKEAGLWKWKDIDSSDDKDAVLLLVQNLKNKNGSGYYHLPIDPGQVGASL